VVRLREELQSLQVQVSEYRKAESGRNAGTKQASSLELILKQERDDKEKALLLVTKLKDECDLLTRDLHTAKKDLASQRAHSAQALSAGDSSGHKVEVEQLRQDLAAIRKELQAVSHHRNVLRETVDQLEKRLRSKADSLAEAHFHNADSNRDLHLQFSGVDDSPGSTMSREKVDNAQTRRLNAHEDEEHVRKQVLRFRARALAMEDLVSIYRAGVIALYSDGASYSAAQFGWQHGNDLNDGLGVGWIEREIGNVKRSYEEEIRLLDGEVAELRAKLRQSVSYISELRKRFEENMKTFYRTNRSQGSDGLLLQYEHVSLSLERAELEAQELAHELAQERLEGKRRHSVLVDDLVKALQARDAALSAVKRLELSCIDAGLQHVSIYEVSKL
jgi:hypothetical protein